MNIVNTLNFAHRGFSAAYPENTLLSFEKAAAAGADGIETDVQLSADGALVIIHDSAVDRTTNAKGYVKDLTLSELRQLNASVHFPKAPIQHIPTLDEYLAWVKNQRLTSNIELKTDQFPYPGIEAKVVAKIKAYGVEKQVILSSFNHYSIMKVKAIDPDIRCGLLTAANFLHPGEYVRKAGAEYLHPLYFTLDEHRISEIHKEGIQINTWTVNDEWAMKFLIKHKVDGIITHHPDKLRDMLAKYAK